MPDAVRIGNEGKRPSYRYDYRSYRRALQIARLRDDGIAEGDAIRIQLFLRGYGGRDIRDALANEYAKYGRGVVAQVRSGYVDNRRPIPPGHKASLVASLGPLDERLRSSNLGLSDDQYIEATRRAKSAPPAPDDLQACWNNISVNENASFTGFAERLMQLLQGMLLFSTHEDAMRDDRDLVTELIRGSDDAQYEIARTVRRALARPEFSELVIKIIEPDAERGSRRAAADAISHSVDHSAGWAALTLVVGLRLARIFPIAITQSEMLACLRLLLKKELALSDLIDKKVLMRLRSYNLTN